MSKEADKPKHNYYYISVKAKHVLPEIRINGGIDLLDYDADDISYTATLPVNLWLAEGNNTINIKLAALPGNSDTPDSEFSAELYLHDPASEFPKPLSILYKQDYPEKDTSEKTPLPQTITADFTLNDKMPTKLWNDAEVLNKLSDNDKVEILKLVSDIQGAIKSNDHDMFLSLFEYKIHEDALAEGKPVDTIREAFASTLTWLNSQEGLEFTPIDKAQFHFEVSPNNKLVTVTKNTGHDAISISSEVLEFDLPLNVALIDASWKIVR